MGRRICTTGLIDRVPPRRIAKSGRVDGGNGGGAIPFFVDRWRRTGVALHGPNGPFIGHDALASKHLKPPFVYT